MNRLLSNSRGARWLAIAALAIPIAVFATPSAQAADGPYNIDGTIPDDPSFTNLPDLFGAVKELGPLNSNTTKIGVIHNDAVPTLGLTNPNAQVDLRQAWLDIERTTGDDPKDWLYFAWERDKNTGSGFIAYEFMASEEPVACDYSDSNADLIANCNPWANRQAGDFMILWDQQGGSLDLYLRTWTGTAPNLVLGPPELIDENLGEAAYSADGFRGEAAINLTDTIGGGELTCLSFANTIPSTVTGNSDTADYKDTILTNSEVITNCTSTTVTTPQTGNGTVIGAGGISINTGFRAVRDSALVEVQGGVATPDGSVAFFLCKVDAPGLCTSGGTSVGSTDLAGASYPATVVSPTAWVTSAGRYCWRAVFTGDADNGIPGSSDSSAGECFTVTPVTPTLSTNAGADVLLGQTVSDSATLGETANQPTANVIETTLAAAQGGAAAGGTITFKLYGPSDTGCGTLRYTSPTVAVSGDGTYNTPNPQFEPAAPGNYHWVAEYSGSLPNTNSASHNTACTDTNEDVTVSSVASSMTTAQRWVPNDNATITSTAGGDLTGSVTFALFNSADCGGSAIYGPVSVEIPDNAGLSETVSTSNTTAVTASGNFSWRVSYDSTNPAQEDIPASCHETSALTITNGGTISSP
jgi:hypothetical protein